MRRLLRVPIFLGMNLVELSLAAVAVSMPFGNNLNSRAILVFCFVAFLCNNLKEKLLYLKANKKTWAIPLVYYLLAAASHFWDESPHKSFSYLETSASLLVFPIILTCLGPLNRESIKRIIVIFAITNILAALYCTWQAYLEYKATDYINVFYYHHISKHIGISAIYFSTYCVFSIVALYYYTFMQKSRVLAQVFTFLGILILTAFTILLSSKMFIFLLYISGIGICMYSFFKFRQNRLRPLIIGTLLIAIPILMLRLPYVYARITETHPKQYVGTEDDQNGFAVRGLLWEKSWKLIKKRPLLGWGYYAGLDELRNEYHQAGFEEGVKQNYNSHNQYLYTWLCFGIPGIILLLGFLLQFLFTVFKKREFLGVYLILLFMMAMMTDCMLEIQKGIVFLMFFGGLFVFNAFPSGGKNSPTNS